MAPPRADSTLFFGITTHSTGSSSSSSRRLEVIQVTALGYRVSLAKVTVLLYVVVRTVSGTVLRTAVVARCSTPVTAVQHVRPITTVRHGGCRTAQQR